MRWVELLSDLVKVAASDEANGTLGSQLGQEGSELWRDALARHGEGEVYIEEAERLWEWTLGKGDHRCHGWDNVMKVS